MLLQWKKLVEKDGVLYREVFWPEGGEVIHQLVLPQSLKGEVLQQLHNDHGHHGMDRTVELVWQRCYWPGMLREIHNHCQQCESCALAKAVRPKPKTVMGDLLARPSTQAIATRDQTANTVAQVLVYEWFYHFRVPARIPLDQERSFEEAVIEQLC